MSDNPYDGLRSDDPYEVLCDSEDRDTWLSLRKCGIGASEAPAVMGVSSYSSKLSVAAAKRGQADEFAGNEFTKAGLRLEPFIAEWALEEMEKKGMPCGLMLVSKHFPWLFCTPDWWVMDEDKGDIPFQIKNSMIASKWDDGVPDDVMVQVQTELIVTQAPYAYVAVLLTGNRLRWSKVEPNYDLQGEIITETKRLWDDIQHGNVIEADGSDASSRALKALYPEDNGETIALDGKYLAYAQELDAVNTDIANLRSKKSTYENELKAAIGEHTFATFSDGTGYSLKTTNRKESISKASTFRTLRRQGEK